MRCEIFGNLPGPGVESVLIKKMLDFAQCPLITTKSDLAVAGNTIGSLDYDRIWHKPPRLVVCRWTTNVSQADTSSACPLLHISIPLGFDTRTHVELVAKAGRAHLFEQPSLNVSIYHKLAHDLPIDMPDLKMKETTTSLLHDGRS